MQLSLFEDAEQTIKNEELDRTIDFVRKKYGYTSLLYAFTLVKSGTAIYHSKLIGGHKSGIDDE
ncbi:hypothetical protein [Oceanobacillus sojae]|uniref:DNA polymerase Y-family little finger domain-containing protein n=1 Tax=Oceanobacillus sojae TaxID=582851 RepID=A0A511ZH65_9BACI|nr:hypothetical protein [Oceanobacillus sojae]GEN86783.1 hypothetical protein OSO01_15220 [Oceanobacillus sojae]